MINHLGAACQGHGTSNVAPSPYSMQIQFIHRYLMLNYAEKADLVLSHAEKFHIKWLLYMEGPKQSLSF